MVDDLKHLRLGQAINRLRHLVVVDDDDLLPVHVQQISSADDAAVLALFVENREIPVAEARHDSSCFLNRCIEMKRDKILRYTEVADRGRHCNKPRCRIGIVMRRDDRASAVLGTFEENVRNRGVHADDNALRAVVDGAHLRLIPVRHHDDIARLHELCHCLRTRADMQVPARDESVRVPDQHLSVKHLENV